MLRYLIQEHTDDPNSEAFWAVHRAVLRDGHVLVGRLVSEHSTYLGALGAIDQYEAADIRREG